MYVSYKRIIEALQVAVVRKQKEMVKHANHLSDMLERGSAFPISQADVETAFARANWLGTSFENFAKVAYEWGLPDIRLHSPCGDEEDE